MNVVIDINEYMKDDVDVDNSLKIETMFGIKTKSTKTKLQKSWWLAKA